MKGEASLHVFGFCSPTDQGCARCPLEFVGQNGVLNICSCPSHWRAA